MKLEDLKGKTIQRIHFEIGSEIEIDFTDGTKINLTTPTFPDGSISDIIIEER